MELQPNYRMNKTAKVPKADSLDFGKRIFQKLRNYSSKVKPQDADR